MSDLIKSVTDGVLEQTKTAANEKASKNELGKDAFLQLLVTQMKYQDPLKPNTDTEFIAQLATFSQLEQIQNLGAISTNTQAFGLVGKNVIVKTESKTGNTSYISGRVDFVNMSGGKAQMSIDGNLYPIEQLDSVIDDTYIIEKGLPGIKDPITLDYDAEEPQDVSFTVNMGEGETVADDVAIMVDTTLLDSSLIHLSGNTITIDKSAFENAPNGIYKVTVVFNDPLFTTVKDKVSLQVKNSTVEPGEEEGDTDETDTVEDNTNSDPVDNQEDTTAETNV
ncbi:hypothetical protein I5677_13900 [Mobilitalea sibirica]|uniref:Basal-body rod modification protein FlgD n=1 Tax=Mobilitalea sibirica TaxID=1462919 RepID=A0A8J7HC29_9FIRM|nr:flagellar hook capping FlgD N-terminal domain-containing protein [Mobilitalea sibirica]MBH1941990.1 hypothetical protein [Mobilitalea sibirica]